MNIIKSVFDYISSMGFTVIVPIMFMLVALCFGLGFSKSFKVGLTIGIGFIGLNMVINLFWQYLTPPAELLLEKFGLHLAYFDAGWMAGSAIGFASPVGTFIIPFALLINIVLLALKLTKTLNVDIWNFWHYCFYGAMAYYITGSLFWGYVMAGVMIALSLKFGDLGAKYIEEEMGLPGISVPQCFAASTIPYAFALDALYDRIPGFNKLNMNSETLSQKLGVFGEPATLGFVLGLIISIIVGYDIAGIISTALGLAALLFLMPRMVKILMEGLIPLSEAAKTFMQKRFKGRDFYIGLDSAITLANPTTILVSIVIIPITIFIALLPFNVVLPAGDLAAGAYYACFFSLIHKNNLPRTLLSTSLLMVAVYALMSHFAPVINTMAVAAGFANESAMGISAGVNVVAGPLLLIVEKLGTAGPYVMVAIAVAVFVLVHMIIRRSDKKNAAAVAN